MMFKIPIWFKDWSVYEEMTSLIAIDGLSIVLGPVLDPNC